MESGPEYSSHHNDGTGLDFERLDDLQMVQKGGSVRMGIVQNTGSDWKKVKINPIAEKILFICEGLKIMPEWLLSVVKILGCKSNKTEWYLISRKSEIGEPIAL